MAWPRSTDYIEAVQNLSHSLGDEELRSGEVTVNQFGLPMVWSGGVADVYRIHNANSGDTWALKCFTKKIEGQADRYRQIAAHLEQSRLPFMVDFRYLDQGIRIRGEWYPAVKMRWVEGGIRLNEFVEEYLDRPRTLRELLRIWVKMAGRLREAAVGHCDLQHGNVLLVPRDDGSLALRLIDYDGVFVPSLAGKRSPELGHPAFQHPERGKERIYSAEVDRFSHLAIYTAIHCLSVGREELWRRFNNDENLLFREGDFQTPGSSDVFRTLWKLPDVSSRALVGRLALACQKPLQESPLLDEVANGEIQPLAASEEQAVESLLGSSSALHPAAVVESTEETSALRLPEKLISKADVDVASPSPEPRQSFVGQACQWLSPLNVPRAIDWVLRKIAGEDNAILHNFLRGLTTIVLVLLAYVSARTVPQWFSGAASDSQVAAVSEHTASLDGSPSLKALPEFNTDDVGMKFERNPAGEFLMGSPDELADRIAETRSAAISTATVTPSLGAPPATESAADLTNAIGMQFNLIPSGDFIMGSLPGEDVNPETIPQHRVHISQPFYLGIFEVTQGQYEEITGEDPSDLSQMTGDNLPQSHESYPVDWVSWEEATVFCERLSARDPKFKYRLPTEAEWEYACRAGTLTQYSCGRELDPWCAWYSDNSGGTTHAVGKTQPNAWGLYDMHGNVREWCSDYYSPNYYSQSPETDPRGPMSGSERVLRGGCCSVIASLCRSASRTKINESGRYGHNGFRVVAIPLSAMPMPETTAVVPDIGPQDIDALDPTPFIRGTPRIAPPTEDFAELPAMRSTLGTWANDNKARGDLFKQMREKTRQGLSQYECRRLIPARDRYGNPRPPEPGESEDETLPQRFVLSGELVAIRSHEGKSYVFVTDSRSRQASDLHAFLQSMTSYYDQPAPMVAIEFDSVAIPTWMSDYRFGEAVHVVVQRRPVTRRQHGPHIDPYGLPPLARMAVSEFKQVFIEGIYAPTMCWCFAGEGIEKANRPDTWVDSKYGRSGTLANISDVEVSPEFLLRSGPAASGISAAISARVQRFTSTRGRVIAHLKVDTSTEEAADLEVHFFPGVEIREFLDYEVGGVVELTGTVMERSRLSDVAYMPPPGSNRPEVIRFASAVTLAGGRIRMQGESSTTVVVGTPPRSNVKITSITPEVAQAEADKSLGKSVVWSGRLYRLERQDGKVHLLVSLKDSLTGLRYFEGYTTEGRFYDSLIDYVPSDASYKADTVEVSGIVRPGDAIESRLQSRVPLLELRGVRRPDDPESAAIVGRRRLPTTFRQETIREGLSAIYHDRPRAGTEVEFSAVFSGFDDRKHVVEVSSDGSHERVKISFPSANKAMFSDYRRRDEVEVKAKVTTASEKELELAGIEIARTKNRRSLVTRSGRAVPPLDLSDFKDRWRKIRYKTKDHLGEQLTGCGVFEEAKTDSSSGKRSISILIKSLFFESSSYTVTLVGPLDENARNLLKSYTSGEEVLFKYKVLQGSSSSKAKGELIWIRRIGDADNRAASVGAD